MKYMTMSKNNFVCLKYKSYSYQSFSLVAMVYVGNVSDKWHLDLRVELFRREGKYVAQEALLHVNSPLFIKSSSYGNNQYCFKQHCLFLIRF